MKGRKDRKKKTVNILADDNPFVLILLQILIKECTITLTLYF